MTFNFFYYLLVIIAMSYNQYDQNLKQHYSTRLHLFWSSTTIIISKKKKNTKKIIGFEYNELKLCNHINNN